MRARNEVRHYARFITSQVTLMTRKLTRMAGWGCMMGVKAGEAAVLGEAAGTMLATGSASFSGGPCAGRVSSMRVASCSSGASSVSDLLVHNMFSSAHGHAEWNIT